MGLNLPGRIRLAARTLLKGGQLPHQARPEIPAITDQEVAEVRQFFPREKFFIFGHARSGTTLLARLVRVHPDVHCNYQAHFFTRPPLLKSLVQDPEVGSWLARRSNRWNAGKDLSPLILRVSADFIMEREALALNKRVVGDKSPNSLVDGESVRLLHDVYPDGRLIYILRDGRDTVLSHRFQTFIDSAQHLSREDLALREAFSRDPEPFLNGRRSIFSSKGLRTAAQGWVRNVSETIQLGQDYYQERFLLVIYEKLLQNPFEEMQKVWEFLGVAANKKDLERLVLVELRENPDADWQQQKANQIAQALQKGKSGSWRQTFTAQDIATFEQIAGDTLQKWGYALSDPHGIEGAGR